jgi:hypothetical protein
VLAADPCSLLDPVAPANAARFNELARDHDGQRGKATDASRCEARLALTLEARGILRPVVTRPPWGEAEDGDGQIWDFKSPHNRTAIAHRVAQKAALSGDIPPQVLPSGYPGEFNVTDEVLRAIGQQQVGKGVVFDLRRVSIDEARALVAAVTAEPRIDLELVKFFPGADDLAAFEAGAT